MFIATLNSWASARLAFREDDRLRVLFTGDSIMSEDLLNNFVNACGW